MNSSTPPDQTAKEIRCAEKLRVRDRSERLDTFTSLLYAPSKNHVDQKYRAIREKVYFLSVEQVPIHLIYAHVQELGLSSDDGFPLSYGEVENWANSVGYYNDFFTSVFPQLNKEKARWLRSQGLSFSFIRHLLKRMGVKTPQGSPYAIKTLSSWCRGVEVSESLLQERAREQEELTQEIARWLRSHGFSLSLILRYLEDIGLSASDRALPTLETLSAWCRDVEVDTSTPYLTPSSSPTAKERARELRLQGLSLSLIQDQLKEQGLTTSKGTTPTLKTLFVWCRDIEVKELKRKDREHGGGRPCLEDMPQHEGLASLIKRERLEGKSFEQIAEAVAEEGHRTARGKLINKTQIIRIWRRISDD